jgi:transposase
VEDSRKGGARRNGGENSANLLRGSKRQKHVAVQGDFWRDAKPTEQTDQHQLCLSLNVTCPETEAALTPRLVVKMVSGGSHFKYSDEVRNLILSQLAAGVRPTVIAETLGVSRPFISQVRARGALDPELLKENQPPRGRRPKVTRAAVERITEYVRENPEAERAEVREVVKNQFGIDVHLTTVGRIMRKIKLSDHSSEGASPPVIGTAYVFSSQAVDHTNTRPTSRRNTSTTTSSKEQEQSGGVGRRANPKD